MKKCILMILLFSGNALAGNRLSVNISLGQPVFDIVNISHEKWSAKRLKIGLEGNYIYREIFTLPQDILDLKAYTGWLLVSNQDLTLDLRIGYSAQYAYYPLNSRSDYGYAPVIGTNIDLVLAPKWILQCGLMGSLFSDSIGIPYRIGVRHPVANKDAFVGLQGIFTLNYSNSFTTYLETGICAGISF